MSWNAFRQGLKDSSEARIAVLLLVKSEKLRRKSWQTFLLNGVIFIGSILLYKEAIEPLMMSLYAASGVDELTSTQMSGYLYTTYILTWILPMYMLSFVLNTVWYQDIASETARLLARTSVRPQPSVPVTLRIADVLYKSIFNGIFILQSNLAYNVSYVGYSLYILHLAFLYALSAFEYRLSSADGWTGERRLALVQKRWAYFAGFGAVPALLAAVFPRFIEAGVLALLIPLGIVAAAAADPAEGAGGSLPIFAPSVWVTGVVVKILDLART